MIFARILRCDPNNVLDIENLSNSSDSCTPNITRQSVPPYPHTHPSLITLLFLSLSQLRLHTRQQDRVSLVAELDGGRVSGAPDHQLGRHPVGQKILRIVDCASHPGYGIVNRGFATCLPRLQGMPFFPSTNLLRYSIAI